MEYPTESEVRTRRDGNGHERFPLSSKQQEFFRRAAMMRQQIDTQMNGALQLIVCENDLKGRVTLADDFTELIIEQE